VGRFAPTGEIPTCEAEVWLLRRRHYTLKEIATELSISINTVKKHLKNIHAKREAVLYMEE
jgi:DNA-binding CsgD family transcriptional regulator